MAKHKDAQATDVKVVAEILTSDRVFHYDKFDVTSYFENVTEEELVDYVEECDFDHPAADRIVEFYNEHPKISEMLRYIRAEQDHPNAPFYFCGVYKETLAEWLKVNRPEWYEKLGEHFIEMDDVMAEGRGEEQDQSSVDFVKAEITI